MRRNTRHARAPIRPPSRFRQCSRTPARLRACGLLVVHEVLDERLSFYMCTAIGCRWLSSLRDLQTNFAAIAVTWCQNDSVAPGYCRRERRKGIIEALDRRVGVQAVRLDRGQELLGPETERRLGAVKRPARLMVQNHHKKQNLPWETLRALSRARTDRLAKSLHSPTVTWGSVAPPLQK